MPTLFSNKKCKVFDTNSWEDFILLTCILYKCIIGIFGLCASLCPVETEARLRQSWVGGVGRGHEWLQSSAESFADQIVGIWWFFLIFLLPFIINSQKSDWNRASRAHFSFSCLCSVSSHPPLCRFSFSTLICMNVYVLHGQRILRVQRDNLKLPYFKALVYSWGNF